MPTLSISHFVQNSTLELLLRILDDVYICISLITICIIFIVIVHVLLLICLVIPQTLVNLSPS